MSEPAVMTQAGKVRGLSKDGVYRFLGVPYAAAPVGPRRFELPQPPEPWDGERDATRFGPTAPQIVRDFPDLDMAPLVGSGWGKGDDYLNVNIWTPDPGARGLPVMVFIHGGAFVAGSNTPTVYDGTSFAKNGVVLMSINYRMGIEGFLPIDGVPTNLGLRDQIAALQWVRDNASAFGGDPGNVTVFGESAGAMTIADLVVSPLARGLFRRAIVQSGHGSMVRSVGVAKKTTRRLARLLKVRPNRKGFESRSVEACLAAQDQVQLPTARLDLREENGREPAYGLSRFLPVHGDDVLPNAPLQALRKGAGSEVELLIGTNVEEMRIYFVPTKVVDKLSRLLAWLVLRASEPRAGKLLKAYGMGRRGEKPGEVLTRAMTDLVFRLPARRFAAAHRGRTHYYEFGWKSPAFGGRLGACHALELPFVFNTTQACAGETGFVGANPPQDMADRIHRIWIGFARDGSLPWPEYAPGKVYALDQGRLVDDPAMPAAMNWD